MAADTRLLDQNFKSNACVVLSGISEKIKIKVREEELLELMLKYNGGKTRTQTKLKSGAELRDLLDAVRGLVPHSRFNRSVRESDFDVEDFEHAQKLLQVKEVLEKT